MFARQLGARLSCSPWLCRLWLPEPSHPIHFWVSCPFTYDPIIYHLSHVQSSQPYILPLCRSHSFTRWARSYSQGRTRTRPEKDVSNNFTNSSSSTRRLTKLSSPSYNRATRKKCYHSFRVFSSALLRSVPIARKNRDGTWTMRGLRAWLAHVFRLRGQTDEVSKQRCLWATAVPVSQWRMFIG